MAKSTPSRKLVLIDKKPRSVLSEGRSWGVGFAFAKRKGRELHLVQPISPCKDYLNEVIYTEATGKPSSACGLSVTKTGCFEDGFGKLVAAECKSMGGYDYKGYNQELEYLNEDRGNVERFLRWWEDKIKIQPTNICKLENNRFLFLHDLFWTKGTYLISLYCCLIRTAIEGQWGVKSTTDPYEYAMKESTAQDAQYIRQNKDKVDRILKGEVPQQDFSKVGCPHGLGICGWQWPKVAA